MEKFEKQLKWTFNIIIMSYLIILYLVYKEIITFRTLFGSFSAIMTLYSGIHYKVTRKKSDLIGYLGIGILSLILIMFL